MTEVLQKGDTFAGYTVRRVLGFGGMGTVYLARHPRLPRLTALKLLGRDLYSDTEIRKRFEREADLVAQLDHPNIVTVYDRGAEDDQLWISMQFVAGADASCVDVGVLPAARAVRIIADTAAALDFAHVNGVLHRDVKPANILLAKAPIGQPERVLLTDFGIASVRDADTTLGSAGSITATLAYAAPEHLAGAALDHRADQYSLACTLFWMLTGAAPYPGSNPAAVINGHLNLPVPSARTARPDLSPAFDAVLMRGLSKEPEERFGTCAEFAAAARAALDGPRSGPHRSVPPQGGVPWPQGGYPGPQPQGGVFTGYPGPQGGPFTGYPGPQPQGNPATGYPGPQQVGPTGYPGPQQGSPATGYPGPQPQSNPATGYSGSPQGSPATGYPGPQGGPATGYQGPQQAGPPTGYPGPRPHGGTPGYSGPQPYPTGRPGPYPQAPYPTAQPPYPQPPAPHQPNSPRPHPGTGARPHQGQQPYPGQPAPPWQPSSGPNQRPAAGQPPSGAHARPGPVGPAGIPAANPAPGQPASGAHRRPAGTPGQPASGAHLRPGGTRPGNNPGQPPSGAHPRPGGNPGQSSGTHAQPDQGTGQVGPRSGAHPVAGRAPNPGEQEPVRPEDPTVVPAPPPPSGTAPRRRGRPAAIDPPGGRVRPGGAGTPARADGETPSGEG
ncbi:protein kinase [Nocardia sp. NPDC057353]|uniref:serine/threonine-protein kinase n=1 Tax=Nocardia sp. NPDC057353 TaxID=3346104 RepID=UPI0036258ACF